MTAAKKNVESEFVKPVGAAAKLAYIQTHLSNVEKTGRNEHHKYNYMQEHGLIDLLRPFLRLLNCSVVLSPGNRLEHDGNRTIVIGSLTFLDGDAPEFYTAANGDFIYGPNGLPVPNGNRSITANFAGEGVDAQDKATNKAHTGFAKYALQKFFLVPTEHVDDSDSEDVKQAARTATGKGDPASPTVIQFLLDTIKEKVELGTLDRNKVQAKLATLQVKRPQDLSADQANEFSTWLEEA